MKKHIYPLVTKNDEDYSEEVYNTLKDNIVKLVTASSPGYHASATLPTYFNSNAARKKGVGVLMKEYFSRDGKLRDFVTFTEQAIKAENSKKWQILRTRVQAAQDVNTTNAKFAARSTKASTQNGTNTIAMVTTSSKRPRNQTLGEEAENSTDTNNDDDSNTADATKKAKQTYNITTHFPPSGPATSSQVASNNQ